MSEFLPVSIEDMKKRGWEELDFIFISGDAYIDHPSFGHAIITRLLEHNGFRVGIIPQPDWKSKDSFMKLGRPKIAFLVSSGNIDSMVNHYTAAKKRRNNDFYSPGGKTGYRPDRAVIVYCNRIREAFSDVPIIIGGIEASLRRFAHYDYWDDRVRNSILIDSSADLLIYGMGERAIMEIANLLNFGKKIKDIKNINGICYISDNIDELKDFIQLPSFEEVSMDKKSYAKAFKIQYEEQDPIRGKTLVQRFRNKYLVQNPPAMPLNRDELDLIYSLPYKRTYHPMYKKLGGIPALQEVEFSITSNRGCFGGCSFCALHFHQGRIVQSRSDENILKEAEILTKLPTFKGYIHDVGGPTANFKNPSCEKQLEHGVCKSRQCLFPTPCPNLEVSHLDYLNLLRKIRKLKGVKKVFIRSGIRYDYLLYDKNNEFFNELVKYHVSGQLKVAPEHVSYKVLKLMGKPPRKVYDRFKEKYFEINKKYGLKQFLVPYLMSSHPGSDINAAIELAEYIRDMGYNPEQVQDFYPTPGSLSTTMYYTELNPITGEKVYVPKSLDEKAMQRALLQFKDPKNYDLVYKALKMAGREDLIGYDRKCLIPPVKPKRYTKVKR
ncbi:YgiQ family radical SAM protein [Caloramator sp. E03]|uniref:YgiQ family radical SAM protein n=1 Tax=Caloramator sp. E03 TaxID=2576307 RepID=UPI0011108FC1|nr:YgiQ family radical SAM protein [Caloramator sp. E03]QCX34626.1 YgiQ family radical SAM protein [Caloramator sp. E03]